MGGKLQKKSLLCIKVPAKRKKKERKKCISLPLETVLDKIVSTQGCSGALTTEPIRLLNFCIIHIFSWVSSMFNKQTFLIINTLCIYVVTADHNYIKRAKTHLWEYQTHPAVRCEAKHLNRFSWSDLFPSILISLITALATSAAGCKQTARVCTFCHLLVISCHCTFYMHSAVVPLGLEFV